MARPLMLCGIPTTAASAIFWVRHQRRFDLGGPQTVSGDVQDVIHPAGDPVIAIFITTRAVAAKAHIFESGEVGLLKALMVAEQGTRTGRAGESAMARLPSVAPSSGRPSLSTSTGWTPKNGRVAEPAFSSIAPGSGVIIKPPVSVCHQCPSPGTSRYRSSSSTTPSASGLIGSPTEPRMRSEERSVPSIALSPSAIRARIAVGAV